MKVIFFAKTTFTILTFGFFANLLVQACSLKPLAWTPPNKPAFKGAIAKNELLSTTTWIDLEGWYGPEDIAVDKKGNLYCGVHPKRTNFESGRILKIDTQGIISTFCNTGAWVTGLHFDQNENLIACDQKRGLIRIDPEGNIQVLANKDEKGRPILMPNDVDIASDGMIYFSNTSSQLRFSRRNARKILLEVKPDGGLYRYNPTTLKVETLIDSSFFGNGVAVSKNDDFVLMVDLAKYRILRYWLKGEKKGKIDQFIDNLPGLPNGISRRKDGSFWLGFTTQRSDVLDDLQPKIGMKKFVYGIPLWLQPKQEAFGMIMHLSETGEILQTLYDTTGQRVSEASSIEEHNGILYLGGDLTDHIGKYQFD
ncbi:SMP-30/gluconolactonase/LRE family protein [Aureispira anguillae]|uniref:SMP-30/gluconolactonase/LRE family protein n=1 Tax=Aureispira anguillae TaxID=2864201 RepID=A0A915YGT0_9BACT|nr:SMP-30/gluconolactonase/LRE family protein [Aureispira anguillae]BDS12887.1 SMP-30/gluconolactonase/LRE family protein [Aureispira anguillae]